MLLPIRMEKREGKKLRRAETPAKAEERRLAAAKVFLFSMILFTTQVDIIYPMITL